MNDPAGDNTPRPHMRAECRAVLQAAIAAGRAPADDPHVRSCPHCAHRLSMHRRLATWLKSRPTPPAELMAPSFLSAVHERVVEACEASPLGDRLDKGMAATPPAAGWPEELLSSRVAQDAVSPPAPLPGFVWAQVQRSILAEVRAAPARRWRRPLWLGLAGAAATLIVAALLRQAPPSPTTIVFTDLDAIPSVDYAVLRYGPPR